MNIVEMMKVFEVLIVIRGCSCLLFWGVFGVILLGGVFYGVVFFGVVVRVCIVWCV